MTTFTVTTTADVVNPGDGQTSLREAVAAANASGDFDTIAFAPALSGQTIVLSAGVLAITTGGLLTIEGDIDGNGTRDITIDANESSTVFTVSTSSIVALDGLAIREGQGTLGNGTAVGAIYNAGDLTITNSYFALNNAYATAPGAHAGGTIVNAGTAALVDTQFYYGVMIGATGAAGASGASGTDGSTGGAAAQILNLAGGILSLDNVQGGYGAMYGGAGGNGGDGFTGPGGQGGSGGAAGGIVNFGQISGNVSIAGGGVIGGAGGFAGDGSPNGLPGATGHAAFGVLSIGTAGADSYAGMANAETYYAGAGNDQAEASGGDDAVFGEDGNDTLTGSDGDTLDGGAGDDRIVDTNVNGGTFAGGEGYDTLDLSQDPGTTGAYDLSAPSFTTDFGGTFSGFEALLGSAGAETIIGSDVGNILDGGGGADSIVGGAGNDVIDGGDGNDTLTGGADADTFRVHGGSAGIDRIADFNFAEDGFDLGDHVTFTAMTESNGNTFLTHPGGQIRVLGVTGHTLEEWNARTWHIVSDHRAITNGDATWGGIGVVGTSAIVTFSFEDTIDPVNGWTPAERASWEPLDATERDYARAVFQAMDAASGLTFIEVPSGQGDIRLQSIHQVDSLAYANAPNFTVSPDFQDSAPFAGDVFGQAPFDNYAGIFWHEIGHAVGFSHVFEGYYRFGPDITIDPFNNTIMMAGGDQVQSLKPVDIEALQYFYGTNSQDGTHVASWSFDNATFTLTQSGFETAQNMRGTFGRDVMFGNGGDDVVFGDAGNDALDGGGDNDTVNGFTGDDSLGGGTGNDKLIGWTGNDSMYGGAGTDTLDGGAGNDTMEGGTGDDVFFVATRNDVVTEATPGGAGGFDTVFAMPSFTLGANIESLFLQGSGNTDGTGNALNNRLYGNDGANDLQGLDGNDSLSGGLGADDLRGGAGNDTMEGGDGNDRYFVDNQNDRTIETKADLATGGIDTVFSTVNRTLAANIENLRLQGSGDLNGNGNELNNKLYGTDGLNILKGFAGADTIDGKGGADTIDGGEGNDTLTGGGGADVFRFAASNAGVDRILDFSRNFDRFDLSGGSFTAVSIAPNGDAVLTHAGGAVRIATPPNLTLAQWNALVIPSGGRVAHDAPATLDGAGHGAFALAAGDPHAEVHLRNDIVTLAHGDFIYA